MAEIQLDKNMVALVDDCDIELLMKHKWYAHLDKCGRHYAHAGIVIGGKRTTMAMHRLILDLHDKKIWVDHKNGNGLDNRRENLRLASAQQNARNRIKIKSSRSKYKGVGWDIGRNRWKASITCDGKMKRIGRYKTEEEAARAYNRVAIELFGEFACLNIIEGD